MRNNAAVQASVRAVLDELCAAPAIDAAAHANDGATYEARLKVWAQTNAAADAAYVFDV